MSNFSNLTVAQNDASKAGQLASARVFLDCDHRFALFAVHTRFDAVAFFVADANVTDNVTGKAGVVAQAATADAAFAVVADAVLSVNLHHAVSDAEDAAERWAGWQETAA